MAGICLRGKPGWGDLGASFTTVLNTFGGTWWSSTADGKPDKAQVDQPAVQDGARLLRQARAGRGREGRGQLELQRMPCAVPGRQGRDVVRRHRRRGPSRGQRQSGEGQERLRPRAGGEDEGVGLALELGARDPEELTRSDGRLEVHRVGDRPGYIKAAGTKTKGGWAAIPPGTRLSTYQIPQYQQAAAAFAPKTLAAMEAAPIDNPGTTKRPGLPGVQYVGIPQFQDVGNRCTQLFSSVIAGSTKDTDRAQPVPADRVGRDQVDRST